MGAEDRGSGCFWKTWEHIGGERVAELLTRTDERLTIIGLLACLLEEYLTDSLRNI